MFSKLLKPFTIFCLIAMVCVLGYTVFVNAQGKGYVCGGDISSDWDTDCNDYIVEKDCKGQGILVATSDKDCEHTGNQSDYCRMTKTKMRHGDGDCSWSKEKKSCRNPSIKKRVDKDDC